MQEKAELLQINSGTDILVTWWIKQEINMTEKKR